MDDFKIPNRAHIFVHNHTPRYTLFDFHRISDGFDAFKGEVYWQGLANYGLWVLTALLVLNIILALFALYIKSICLERPYSFARRELSSAVSIIGFICTKLAILAFFCVIMAYFSWRNFNKKLNAAPLHNTACPYIETLGPLSTSLPGYLLNGDGASTKANAIAAAINDDAITAEVGKINTYIANLNTNMEAATASAKNISEELMELCEPNKKAGVKLKKELKTFITGILISVFTIILGFIMVKAISMRSTFIMTVLIVIAWLTLLVWGFVASIVFMTFLAVTDLCYDPYTAAKNYLPTVNPAITQELIGFYLGCKNDHPFKNNFTVLETSLKPLIGDAEKLKHVFELAPAFEIHGEFARDFHKTLTKAVKLVKSVTEADCKDSIRNYHKLLSIPCRNLYWGLGSIFAVGVLLTLFLAAFMMICMRIRKFLTAFVPPKPPPRPTDACPYTCPGPEADNDTPLYFMPAVPEIADECPPSCRAFPALLRKFTYGLNRKSTARAERFACTPDCKKVYYDKFGNLLPPECIPVSEKSVETENAYMCTQAIKEYKKAERRRKGKEAKEKKLRGSIAVGFTHMPADLRLIDDDDHNNVETALNAGAEPAQGDTVNKPNYGKIVKADETLKGDNQKAGIVLPQNKTDYTPTNVKAVIPIEKKAVTPTDKKETDITRDGKTETEFEKQKSDPTIDKRKTDTGIDNNADKNRRHEDNAAGDRRKDTLTKNLAGIKIQRNTQKIVKDSKHIPMQPTGVNIKCDTCRPKQSKECKKTNTPAPKDTCTGSNFQNCRCLATRKNYQAHK